VCVLEASPSVCAHMKTLRAKLNGLDAGLLDDATIAGLLPPELPALSMDSYSYKLRWNGRWSLEQGL
jgi:hypothetical protein